MSEHPIYYRTASPDSYFEVCGELVTYFAPHVAAGGAMSQWSAADILRCAAKRPATDGEMTSEELRAVRARLQEAVLAHEKRTRDDAAMEASRWNSKPEQAELFASPTPLPRQSDI